MKKTIVAFAVLALVAGLASSPLQAEDCASLRVVPNNVLWGTVAKDVPNCSDGINYIVGSAVVVNATPKPGYKFCKWTWTPAGLGCDGAITASCGFAKAGVAEVGKANFVLSTSTCP